MKCSKSLRFLGQSPKPRGGSLQRSPDPLVAKDFLPSAIAALCLRHSQFELLAHSHNHHSFYISSVSPCRLPLLNSVELTNYGYFCMLCPPPICCVSIALNMLIAVENHSFLSLDHLNYM